MELRDCRRLTGANFMSHCPGAVIEVLFGSDEGHLIEPLVSAWKEQVRSMLNALNWQGESIFERSLGVPHESRSDTCEQARAMGISAPLDALYAATSVAEWALNAAVAQIGGPALEEGLAPAQARIALEIQEESNPALLALRSEAHTHGVQFLSDDDEVSVGLGSGSRTWAVNDLPKDPVRDLDWSKIHDIPHAIITGTNGKSTTVRIVSAMVAAAGQTPGVSSTDWVRVGTETLDSGDWSGPGGARRVLRDQRVQLGLLETARGGLMRRGVALESIDLAVILNISADHLSDWGTPDLESLTEAKFIVTKVAKRVLLNADDPYLVEGAKKHLNEDTECIWFSLEEDNPIVAAHLSQGGRALLLRKGALVLAGPWDRGQDRVLCLATEVPLYMGGAARYNLANALAAAAIAADLGLDCAAITTTLTTFQSDATSNPGRMNRFSFDGIEAIVDFAHNPGGLSAVLDVARSLTPKRLLIVFGHAGDRDERSTLECARIIHGAKPDLVIIKELTLHLRGRALGEMPALIEAALTSLGHPSPPCAHAPSELAAVTMALEWAQPGDLLVLFTHDSRDEILELMAAREK